MQGNSSDLVNGDLGLKKKKREKIESWKKCKTGLRDLSFHLSWSFVFRFSNPNHLAQKNNQVQAARTK